jgi:hypothetical protein
MSELRLFITSREKEIREELEPLLERRKAIRAELDEIAPRVLRLKKELDELERAQQAISGTDQEQPKKDLTIKEAVLKVLEDEKRGMTAQQILVAINERFFDGNVVRSSLSPQLSRLNHDDHKVKYDGLLWSLRTENDEGPASAEPSFLD